jgi:membrane complex biogenesis BtpA family protein
MINLKLSNKTIVGMIHVDALPGTPQNCLSMEQIIDRVKNEVEIYCEAGVDAIMVANMHDVPYLKGGVGSEITAAMTAVAVEMRWMTDLPMGIQILAAANKQALAVAHAANFEFIRAEGFVYGHLADEGYIDSCAGDLLRYRKMIGADDVAIFTDIKKKHSSHVLTSDVTLAETVKTAEYFLSDGVIITGTSTGEAALIDDVKLATLATNLPLIIGSGITTENLKNYWPFADVFIVGSSLKFNGDWKNRAEKERVIRLVNEANVLTQLEKNDIFKKKRTNL